MTKIKAIGVMTTRPYEGVMLRVRKLKTSDSPIPFSSAKKITAPQAEQVAMLNAAQPRITAAAVQTSTRLIAQSFTRAPPGLNVMSATLRLAFGGPPMALAGSGTSVSVPASYMQSFGQTLIRSVVAPVARGLSQTPIGRIGALMLMPSALGKGSYMSHQNKTRAAPRQVNPASYLLDEIRSAPTAHEMGWPPPRGITIEEVPVDDTQNTPTTHERPDSDVLAPGSDSAPGFLGMPIDLGWGLHKGQPSVPQSIKALEGFRPTPPNALDGILLKEGIYYPTPSQDLSGDFVRNPDTETSATSQGLAHERVYRYQPSTEADPEIALSASIEDTILRIEQFEYTPSVTAQDKVNVLNGLLTHLQSEGLHITNVEYTLKHGTHLDYERVTDARRQKKSTHEAVLGNTELGQFFFRNGYFRDVVATTPTRPYDPIVVALSYGFETNLTPEAINWNTHTINRFRELASDPDRLTVWSDESGMIYPPGNINNATTLKNILEADGAWVPGLAGARLDGSEQVVRFEDLAKLSVALGRDANQLLGAEVSLKRNGKHSVESGPNERFFLHSGTHYTIRERPTEQSLGFSRDNPPKGTTSYSMAHTHPFDVKEGQIVPGTTASKSDQLVLKEEIKQNPNMRRQHSRIIALNPPRNPITVFYGPDRTLGPMTSLAGIKGAPGLSVQARIMNGVYTVRLSGTQNIADIDPVIQALGAMAGTQGHNTVRFELGDPKSSQTDSVRTQILKRTRNNATLSRAVFYDFVSGHERYSSTDPQDLRHWLLTWTEPVPKDIPHHSDQFVHVDYAPLAKKFDYLDADLSAPNPRYELSPMNTDSGLHVIATMHSNGSLIEYTVIASPGRGNSVRPEIDIVGALQHRLASEGHWQLENVNIVINIAPNQSFNETYILEHPSVRAWRNAGFELDDTLKIDTHTFVIRMKRPNTQ